MKLAYYRSSQRCIAAASLRRSSAHGSMPTRQYRRTKIAGKLGRPAAEIYEIRPEATGSPRRYRARKPKTVTVQLAVAPAVVAPRIVDPIEAPVVSHIKSGSPVDGARVLQKMRGLSKYESWLKVEQLKRPIGNGAASAH